MRYALTKTVTTSQEQFVRTYGDEVWEWMCNRFTGSFDVARVAEECPVIQHLATRTRTDCARSIIANVLAEYTENPDECPIIRRGNSYYMR